METVTSSHVAHAWHSCVFFCREHPPPPFPRCCSLSLDYFEKRSHPAQAFEIIVFFEGLTCFHMKSDMGVKFVSGGIWNRENVWHIKNFILFLRKKNLWKHWSHLVWKWYSENKKLNQHAGLYSKCYLMPARLMQIPRSQIYWPQTEPQLNGAKIFNLLPVYSAILNKIITAAPSSTHQCAIDPVSLRSCMPIACTDSPLIIGLFCIVRACGFGRT